MLSPALLHPLQATSVDFEYCFDRTLHCTATRYTNTTDFKLTDSSDSACLIFACGISLSQETWIPIIKELFRLSSTASRIPVGSAWVVERPNHGTTGLMNAELLKQHYSAQFPSLQYSTAIHTFLTSNILSASERRNLVGIGHSGGGGSLIQALNYGLRDGHNIPLKSLILVEAPLVGPEVWPFFLKMYDAVKKSNARRTTSWPSKDAAMKWFATRSPWKSFSPDVLQIVEDTYFIPDARRPGFITTKTTVEQETACFVDNGTNLHAGPFLLTILDILPTHIIAGRSRDMWPPPVYDLIDQNTAKARPYLASVTVMDDVGHYLPVVKPRAVAAQIFEDIQTHAEETIRSKL
ncbi:hypothetical protein B0H16DRAFT_1823788 [Mycena metata]|uniref:AB hydrolase-1 domain-containing protein n=1 Tax=Mycena metata TaxID=1033252 RepID=A0AAD7J6Q1_9AGAR|nr:hypothetical protein B0H16DRAFT_1823788 [Mycena metata]